MQLRLNGQPYEVADDSPSLKRLLENLGYEPAAVAVALEGRFVPRHEYDTCVIREHQAVEVVSPMQGG